MFNLNGTEDLNTHADPIASSKGLAPKAEGNYTENRGVRKEDTELELNWNWVMEGKLPEPMNHIKTCQL